MDRARRSARHHPRMTIRFPAPIGLGLSVYLMTLLAARWWPINGLLGAALATAITGIVCLRWYRQLGGTMLAVALGLMFAVLIQATRIPTLPHDDISRWAAHAPATIDGWIAEAPERQPTRTRYVVQVAQRMDNNGDPHEISGRIIINDTATWPMYDIGDAVHVRGTIELPGMINTFDEAASLRVRGITAVIRRASLEPWNTAHPAPRKLRWTPMRPLNTIRAWCERQITRILPEPHASLLAGLLTGSRVGLPREIADAFRVAGLSHIVAISGYNITIILALCSHALFWLPRRKRLVPLIMGTVTFVLFVGAGAPVVRAGIMGILGLLALEADRPLSPRLLTLWTATLMAAWNPLMLQYDVSFQLSFLATMGLVELSPMLLGMLWRVPSILAIRESLAATIAAQIATLPLSILIFRQFSLVAPISNLLVAPLIPLAMLTGAIATLVGAVAEPIGLLLATAAWLILSAILHIGILSASLPLASLQW